MKAKLYAIYDELTESYGQIMVMVNDKVAIRGWQSFVKDKDPKDIEGQYVCCLGSYDTETGIIEPMKPIYKVEEQL